MTDQQEYIAFFTNRQNLLSQIKRAFQYLNKPFTETTFYRTTMAYFLVEISDAFTPGSSAYNQAVQAIKQNWTYETILKKRIQALNELVSNENQIALNNIAYEDWVANYENPIDTILKYGQYIALGIGFVLLMKTMKD